MLLASGIAGSARALTPEQVFEKVSPSVWAVRALDSTERPFGFGSGVVIGPGRMVTNCHVLAKAKYVQVKRESSIFEATLEHADVERDLCTLAISGLAAPAVVIGGLADLKVGQRVYAIGNPVKLALTLSEGLVSGLRSEVPTLPPIQTSAAISPGSSGGGLFDMEGRLVGITTLIVVDRARLAQNLNFAIPADWIAEVPERAKAALEARKAARSTTATTAGSSVAAIYNPAASSNLPQLGSSYRYAWTDHQYSRRRQEFQILVTGVNDWTVMESYAVESGPPVRSETWAKANVFLGRRLAEGQTLVEFAPYLQSDGEAATLSVASPSGYPDNSNDWNISLQSNGREPVTVPAGTFNALRIELRGIRSIPTYNISSATYGGVANRFEFVTWYVPELRRYVKSRHRSWNAWSVAIGDEQVELLEYRPK